MQILFLVFGLQLFWTSVTCFPHKHQTTVKYGLPVLLLIATQPYKIQICVALLTLPFLSILKLIALCLDYGIKFVPVRYWSTVLLCLAFTSPIWNINGAICLVLLMPQVCTRITGALTFIVVILELDAFIFGSTPWYLTFLLVCGLLIMIVDEQSP